MVHPLCAIFGTVVGVSKFEHRSPDEVMAHAAVVGHLLRGTVLEGKEYPEALEDAYAAVGDDSQHFQRRRVRNLNIPPQ